jgi:hypothetical protein
LGQLFGVGAKVDYHHVAYLFAIAMGIVSSGAIGSLWAIAADEAPSLDMLEEADLWMPLRIIVVVLSGPTTLIINSFWWLIEKPIVGLVMLAAGLSWSFFQGVVILTQVFGAT